MPLNIKLHAVPHLKGLIYGKNIPGSLERGSTFIEGVAQKLRQLRPFQFGTYQGRTIGEGLPVQNSEGVFF